MKQIKKEDLVKMIESYPETFRDAAREHSLPLQEYRKMISNYFSYSYWDIMRRQHLVGWVYAEGYDHAYEVLRKEFVGLRSFGALADCGANTYHNAGKIAFLRLPSVPPSMEEEFAKLARSKRKAFETAWDAGYPPNVSYLFICENEEWTKSSYIWESMNGVAQMHVDRTDTGEIRFSMAYVMPPFMSLDNLDMVDVTRKVLEAETQPMLVGLHPDYYVRRWKASEERDESVKDSE